MEKWFLLILSRVLLLDEGEEAASLSEGERADGVLWGGKQSQSSVAADCHDCGHSSDLPKLRNTGSFFSFFHTVHHLFHFWKQHPSHRGLSAWLYGFCLFFTTHAIRLLRYFRTNTRYGISHIGWDKIIIYTEKLPPDGKTVRKRKAAWFWKNI